MDLSNEILLEKYNKEILLIKNIVLGKASDNISNLKFLEALKVVINNNELEQNDIVKISQFLEIDESLFKKIYEEFYKDSNKLNVINFEFPRYILEKSEFDNDSDIIKNIVNIVNSSRTNIQILQEFRPIDLISRDRLELVNSFLTDYIFEGKIKRSIENLTKELQYKDKYMVIKAKLKEEYNYLLKSFKKEFEILSQEKEYYARILYPYISLHDKTTLREVVTVKLESIEMKYL